MPNESRRAEPLTVGARDLREVMRRFQQRTGEHLDRDVETMGDDELVQFVGEMTASILNSYINAQFDGDIQGKVFAQDIEALAGLLGQCEDQPEQWRTSDAFGRHVNGLKLKSDARELLRTLDSLGERNYELYGGITSLGVRITSRQ